MPRSTAELQLKISNNSYRIGENSAKTKRQRAKTCEKLFLLVSSRGNNWKCIPLEKDIDFIRVVTKTEGNIWFSNGV